MSEWQRRRLANWSAATFHEVVLSWNRWLNRPAGTWRLQRPVFNEILLRRREPAVATKSILWPIAGFDGDLTELPAAQVAEAARRWRDRGGVRLQDRVCASGRTQALRPGKPPRVSTSDLATGR